MEGAYNGATLVVFRCSSLATASGVDPGSSPGMRVLNAARYQVSATANHVRRPGERQGRSLRRFGMTEDGVYRRYISGVPLLVARHSLRRGPWIKSRDAGLECGALSSLRHRKPRPSPWRTAGPKPEAVRWHERWTMTIYCSYASPIGYTERIQAWALPFARATDRVLPDASEPALKWQVFVVGLAETPPHPVRLPGAGRDPFRRLRHGVAVVPNARRHPRHAGLRRGPCRSPGRRMWFLWPRVYADRDPTPMQGTRYLKSRPTIKTARPDKR